MKAKWGFGNSTTEVKHFVKTFVDTNISEDTPTGAYLRKYCKFKNNLPGEDWCTSFMRKYRLSCKLPSSLEKSRKSAASDPEVIYEYFGNVKAEIDRLKILERQECVWNVDETFLFIDPSRTKVISPIGTKASRVTSTSGKEAITVMAGISASGEKLPPFILFKGKKFWSTWKGTNPYPGTRYSFSDSGSMVSEVFNGWFDFFCEHVTQRPLLLVYDGHSTHLTLAIIKKARAEDITIIKLPPHTTDLLQPLDVCCFKPLKTRWDAIIAKWQATNYARRITKSEFVDLVGKVWEECFSLPVVKMAFKKTGLYPPDKNSYPIDKFNPDLYRLYVSVHETEEPTHKPATPSKQHPPRDCSPSTSFEQIMADVFRKPIPSTSGTQRTARRKIDTHSRVITHDEFLKAVEEREKQTLEKKKKAETKGKGKGKKTKAAQKEDSSEEEDIDALLESLEEEEIEMPENRKKEADAKTRGTKTRAAKERKEEESEEEDSDAFLERLEEEEIESSSRKRKVEGEETSTKKTKLVTSTPNKDKEESGSDLLSMEESDIDSSEEEDKDDEEEAGFVIFNAQKYLQLQKKKRVIENEYYAVDYGKLYIGRVQESSKSSVKMTFLARKPDNRYDWPKKEDSDSDIHFKYIFAGPIKMVGTTPFHIRGVDEAYKHYIKFSKQSSDL